MNYINYIILLTILVMDNLDKRILLYDKCSNKSI